ncbi:MAG: helix-turn-helix domain-containing protein [Acidimicrobiia bacterium]|nr:helix-turn-helix domain-containing protein [Acidimicrobiia bacterium]
MSTQIDDELDWDPLDPYLRPRQAARLLGVEPRTVSNWARHGLLEAHRTPGGHHRFRLSEVQRLANSLPHARRPSTPWWTA